MKIERELEDVEAAIKQADRGIKTADTINEVKYWQGFYAALEWLTTPEKKEDGFSNE